MLTGVIVFVMDKIVHEVEVIEIEKLKLTNITVQMSNEKTFEVSAIYRSHEIPKTAFLSELSRFIKLKKEIKNHFIVGDFNMNRSFIMLR